MKTLKKSIKNITKGSLLLFILNTTSCGEDNPTGPSIQGTSLTITPDPARITQVGSNYQTEQLLFEFGSWDFVPFYATWDPRYTAKFYTLNGTGIGETTDYIDPFSPLPGGSRNFYGRLDIPSTVVSVVTGQNQNSFHADVFLYHMERSSYTQQTTETERITLSIQ